MDRTWRDWIGPFTTYIALGVLFLVAGVLPMFL